MVTWPWDLEVPNGSSPKAAPRPPFALGEEASHGGPHFVQVAARFKSADFILEDVVFQKFYPAFLQLISEVSGKRPFYRWKINRCGEVSIRTSCGAATESEHSDTDNVSWHLRCAEKVACSGQAV